MLLKTQIKTQTAHTELHQSDGAEFSDLDDAPSQPSCGKCTVCCEVMGVPEFNKPHHEPCEHCTGAACSIYAARPLSCREFDCAYIRGIFGAAQELRPDILGVMLYLANTQTPAFIVVEARRNALHEPPVQLFVERLKSAGVRVVVRRSKRVQ